MIAAPKPDKGCIVCKMKYFNFLLDMHRSRKKCPRKTCRGPLEKLKQ